MSERQSERPRATSARRGPCGSHLTSGPLPRCSPVSQDIGDMGHPPFQEGPASRRPASTLDRHGLDIFDELRRVTVSLREEEHSILLPSYRGVVGAAKAASRFNE